MADRIADYALIGDGETAALIDRAGSIDWLCWPRFDSQACFAALLGDTSNGRWSVAPDGEVRRRTRSYRGETLILETRFETDTGTVELTDFMPMRGEASDIVRIVSGVSGTVAMRSALNLKFDHGRLTPWWRTDEDGASFVAGPHACRIQSPVALEQDADEQLDHTFEVRAGERLSFVLTYHASRGAIPARVDPEAALHETETYWTDWSGRCTYDGPWRSAVIRSLITLKAMVYRPSGGLVAAPTSSLPEAPQGTLNWDYRFCWLRDATFTLLAFMSAGYDDEAEAWRQWLLRATACHPAQLQPVYGVDGEQRLTEWTADWLSGFGGATPVRFGNQAFTQRQLDIYGEVMDALHHAYRAAGTPPPPAEWVFQCRLVAHIESVWREPDAGIWEARGELLHYTYSKVAAWVAVDRAIAIAERFDLDAPLDRWRDTRSEMHAEICDKGFDKDRNAFVAAYDRSFLDASLLQLASLGFLPADDPRVQGTVKAVTDELGREGYVYRFATGGDGPAEGSFLACSFWRADALVLEGRMDEAQAQFQRLLDRCNDVGLLAEEYDPDAGTLLGNFPQALSHLGLVNTACNLQGGDGPAKRRGGAR